MEEMVNGEAKKEWRAERGKMEDRGREWKKERMEEVERERERERERKKERKKESEWRWEGERMEEVEILTTMSQFSTLTTTQRGLQ